MYTKLVGTGLAAMGSILIYTNRHLDDDSLLLGSGLILTGILLFTIGLLQQVDSKRK
jgi:hypothetical protein